MMATSAAPSPSGAGPTGPEGERVGEAGHQASSGPARASPPPEVPAVSEPDPLFQGEEREEAPTKRATLLFQFFIVPLAIVVLLVAPLALFGGLFGSERSPAENLRDVRSGSENVQKQSAQQLATALSAERERVRAGKIPTEKAFYFDTAFRNDLRAAYEESFPSRTLDRQKFLTLALGFVGDPAYLAVLVPRLEPSGDVDLRRATVKAIADLDTSTERDREAVSRVLAGLVADPDEPIRNFAVVGLSRRPTDTSRAALRQALGDSSVFVKSSAAAALASIGEDPGAEAIANLLDPAWVERHVGAEAPTPLAPGAEAPATGGRPNRRAALQNGIRAALALRTPSLREKVESLTKDADREVAETARAALAAWGEPR